MDLERCEVDRRLYYEITRNQIHLGEFEDQDSSDSDCIDRESREIDPAVDVAENPGLVNDMDYGGGRDNAIMLLNESMESQENNIFDNETK